MKLALCFILSALICSIVFAQSVSPGTPETQQKVEKQESRDAFLREQDDDKAKDPKELSFTLRLKNNRKQFQLGEIIPLELSFASSKPNAYTLDAATYDRSGRLHSDYFVIDKPDAAVDPLYDYFFSQLHGYMMGGLRSIPDLTDKPHLITADLNEWKRIDKPGHYRLYAVSNRIGTKETRVGSFWNTDRPGLVSNVIEFDILLSDEKWAKRALDEAIAVLAKPNSEHNNACRTLRFLGTPAAAIEMRKRFRGDDNECEWEYKFGLIGSPHRDFVIRDMENAITLREQPVTSHYIDTLALLEFTKRAEPMPTHVGDTEEEGKQYKALMDRREKFYNELRLQYVRQLAMAIPEKQGQARATSLQTLLDNRSHANRCRRNSKRSPPQRSTMKMAM